MPEDHSMTTAERLPVDEEQTVAHLQRVLQHEAAMPIGLIPRLQVHVLNTRRAAARASNGERVVLASLVFSIAACTQGTFGVLGALVVSILYVHFADWRGPEGAVASTIVE